MKISKITALITCACILLSACGSQTTGSSTQDADSASSAGQTASATAESSVQTGSGNTSGETKSAMPVPAFTTEDLDGNEVTESILKDKDVTMINIWGTFCPPCIEEMPELAKLSASLPENAQIIGILCDVSLNDKSALQDAKSIVSKAGTNYPCLLLNDSLTDYLSQFMYVPTTIFVDSEGNQIGEPVVGADFNAYTVRLQKVIGDWTKN
ncbi:MAG: TlpA disulfide reductase family protein [Eubacteriales bacterium]